MPIEYYEDLELHQTYRSREYLLIEKDIIDFARQWDPQPLHTDPEAAKKTKLGGLCASGYHIMAIVGKLVGERKSKLAAVAGTGFEKVQFLIPARPGDALILENEVISKRESKSNSNVGVVRFSVKLINQRGEPVLTQEITVLVEKRPTRGAL